MSAALAVMEDNRTLAQLDRARQMLAECRDLSEVKKIRDIASAAKVYMKAANLGREAQNTAAEIALLASRKAGEILKQLEKTPAGGDRKSDRKACGVISEYSRRSRTRALKSERRNSTKK